MNKLRDYLANEMLKLSIADKIYAIVAALVILSALLLAMSFQSVRLQTAFRDDLGTSATAALNVERVNSLIYAIVMDSRGIYMSEDRAKAKLFGDSILGRNRDLSKVVSEWQDTVRGDDAEVFAVFKKRIDQFIDFRAELVRRAVEISPAAGREWGDNEVNRTTRTALNDDLGTLEKIYAERARHAVELGQQGRYASWYLATLGLGALLLTGLNLFVIKHFVITPLVDITRVTDSIAAGKIILNIPYLTRRDEIGRLAHAVQSFIEATRRNFELEERELGTAKQRDAALEERETAVEELDKLNDKYNVAKWQVSAAVNNMAQGLVMLDKAMNVVIINDQYRHIYRLPAIMKAGCSLNDILQYRVRSGLLAGDAEQHLAAIKARIANRDSSNHEIELADGRFIRITSRPMDGGGWISTHEDCTEERRMQRVLEQTERFLVTVIENVAEAIAAKDARSLRYVFVNRAAEKIFNLPRASIMGKTAREIFSPDLAEMIERGDRRLLEGTGQEPPEVAIHAVDTPEGRRVRAVRRVPIPGPDGESRVFLSMIEDRTDWAKEAPGKILAA